MHADGTEPAVGGHPSNAEALWLVHGTMGSVVEVRHANGERATMLAVRVGSRLNRPDDEAVTDDRTYVLGLDEAVGLLSGLMQGSNAAFGRAAVMSAMADELHIDPTTRDRTAAAVERAVGGEFRDE